MTIYIINDGRLPHQQQHQQQQNQQQQRNQQQEPQHSEGTSDSSDKSERSNFQKIPKLLGGIVLVTLVIGVLAGVIVTVIDSPGDSEFDKVTNSEQKNLNNLEYACSFEEKHITRNKLYKVGSGISMLCTNPYKDQEGIVNAFLSLQFTGKRNNIQSIEFNVSLVQLTSIQRIGQWTIHKLPNIKIEGRPAECGGDGYFTISLITPTKTYNSSVILQIDANVTLELSAAQTKDDENKISVFCISSSACKPASVTLLGYIQRQYGPLRHEENCSAPILSDFWSISCIFKILKETVRMHEQVGCRLHLSNSTENESTEAKLPKNVLLCGDDENCRFHCDKTYSDRYYSDPKNCTYFHRCVSGITYSSPCAPGTFFSTRKCACTNMEEVIEEGSCNADGLRRQLSDQNFGCGD